MEHTFDTNTKQGQLEAERNGILEQLKKIQNGGNDSSFEGLTQEELIKHLEEVEGELREV